MKRQGASEATGKPSLLALIMQPCLPQQRVPVA